MVRTSWETAKGWGDPLSHSYFENLPSDLENLYNSSSLGYVGARNPRAINGEVIFDFSEVKKLLNEYGAKSVADFTPFSSSKFRLNHMFHENVDIQHLKRVFSEGDEKNIQFFDRGRSFWSPPSTRSGLLQSFNDLEDDILLSKDLKESSISKDYELGTKLLYSTLSRMFYYGMVPLYLCHEHDNPPIRDVKKSIGFAEKIGKLVLHGVYGDIYENAIRNIDLKKIDIFPEENNWSDFSSIPEFLDRHNTWYRPTEGQNIWENMIHGVQVIKTFEEKGIDIDTIVGIYWGGISSTVVTYGLFHILSELDKTSLNQPGISYITYSSESHRWKKNKGNDEDPLRSLESNKTGDTLTRFVEAILMTTAGEDILLQDDLFGSGKTMATVRNYLSKLTSNENILSTSVEISKTPSELDSIELCPEPTFKQRRVNRLKRAKKQQTTRKSALDVFSIL